MLSNKKVVLCLTAFTLVFPFTVFAGGKGDKSVSKGSEVVVRRVDSNQLINLRVYLDGKSKGTLKVGQTVVYKVPDGYHTIRVGFEDYQARSTEVAQFNAYNSRHVFSVTDTSIVLVNETTLPDTMASAPSPVLPVAPPVADASAEVAVTSPSTPAVEMRNGNGLLYNQSSVTLDNALRTAFDKSTRSIKKGKKILVLNVDGDNTHEANYLLEEITTLGVNSPKSFTVIDRRLFDAYRLKNSIGLPSYENDYVLKLIGETLGADYVISGRLDGPGDLRRLRIKVMEVSSGRLIGDSSERL